MSAGQDLAGEKPKQRARSGQREAAIGATPEDFSRHCAAPTVKTPGNVQPGIGKGLSKAPVARMMRRDLMTRDRPEAETPSSSDGEAIHTTAPGR